MMKKIMILALVWCVATVALIAQPNNKREKINAAKVAYITDRLDLSEKESAAFWPLYNRFEKEKKDVNKKYGIKRDADWMTDEEAEKTMLNRLQMEEDITKLKRNFYWEFKMVIPPRKIVMLPKAEREFKKMVLNRMQNNRNPNNQRRQRPGGN
jgi:Skp family chaperone for outer membrane proteins